MKADLAKRLLELLERHGDVLPEGVSPEGVYRLVSEVMGENLSVFADGRLLIWDIARHDGYNIPAYPMAGCGDVKEFLSDEGVRNVPQWYERVLGMERSAYDRIWEYELVMVRNTRHYRRVWTVPASVMARGSRDAGSLLSLMREWLGFALGDSTAEDDHRLFKR